MMTRDEQNATLKGIRQILKRRRLKFVQAYKMLSVCEVEWRDIQWFCYFRTVKEIK